MFVGWVHVMNAIEWENKYNKLIKIAKDLRACPYMDDFDIICENCELNKKCMLIALILWRKTE